MCAKSGKFFCADGLCLEAGLRCDGVRDCADDELNCGKEWTANQKPIKSFESLSKNRRKTVRKETDFCVETTRASKVGGAATESMTAATNRMSSCVCHVTRGAWFCTSMPKQTIIRFCVSKRSHSTRTPSVALSVRLKLSIGRLWGACLGPRGSPSTNHRSLTATSVRPILQLCSHVMSARVGGVCVWRATPPWVRCQKCRWPIGWWTVGVAWSVCACCCRLIGWFFRLNVSGKQNPNYCSIIGKTDEMLNKKNLWLLVSKYITKKTVKKHLTLIIIILSIVISLIY